MDIHKQLQKAQQVYARWMNEQTDDAYLEINVEVFMSHYLYQDLLQLRDESIEEIGCYVKIYLQQSQQELNRIRGKQMLN